MLNYTDTSRHIRPGSALIGALEPGGRIATARPNWTVDVLDIELNRAKSRGFMRHTRPDTCVAQPEYRRATQHRRAGRGGIVH